MTNDKKTKKKGKWTRRAFIITGGVVGGGLLAGVGGMIYMNKKIKEYSGVGFGEGHSLNAWIRIAPDNTVTVAVPRAEMGQGVYTAIPMCVAEELEVPMSAIRIVHPQPEGPYANTFLLTNQPPNLNKGLSLMEKIASFMPVVATGGSTTIRGLYDILRVSGATAREALLQAAADHWGIEQRECKAENGHVVNLRNKEKRSYGDLTAAASKVKIEKLPALKPAKDFKIIGQPVQRLDVPDKVTGSATFGLDIRLDGMLYGVVRHCSYLGGAITAINNQPEVEAMPGVKKIVLLPKGRGVVVVADNTWRARNAAMALDPEETGDTSISSEKISKMMEQTIENGIIATPLKKGNVADVLNKAKPIEAKYEVPYLAHACMEPLNCTVLVSNGTAEGWCGHQSCSLMKTAIHDATGIPKNKITTNITYLGGGFGRRSEIDMVLHAAHVAKEMEGTPVQLVYTREECMRNDMYRPGVASHFRAVLSDEGEIEAWQHKMALQSVSYSSMNRIMPMMAEAPKKDPTSAEGAANLPYAMKNAEVAFGQLELPIQVGYWRSVGSSQNAFFTECFMDECARAAGQDPYQFRRNKLDARPRFKAVLDKVAEMSRWSEPLPEGKYRGIALHESFGSIVGQVAEISRLGEKEFKIDRYYCAVDCGRTINPDTIEAQLQSGIIFGLSAALYGEITFANGQAQQFNFPQYEMVRMKTAPGVEVHIMEVDKYPGGIGEVGTPPAAPALVNALFAATGQQVRSLPLVKHGFRFA
ncbi:MAG TPA: xanthine dehydrogenase family protein molybdopterin-binding subunit [Bacteroidetes bacterium]|nr:xanthine dehydrogenase family protein molybdopterin-binding subunit [Bacteroidota bacterium]